MFAPLLPLLLALTPQYLPISAKWCLPQGCIGLEVPQTAAQFQQGLMQRPALDPWRGMWFRFEPARPVGFWMKNCLAPLDLVFTRDGQVVGIEADVPPCTADPCPSYRSPGPVDGVIELRAGRAKELGLKPGSPAVPVPGSTGLGAYRQPAASPD